MAKRKLTSKQRKARKKASYIRSEYFKNFDALDYLRDFAKFKEIKIPSKITKRSLEAIRKIYKEVRNSIEKLAGGGYVNPQTGEYLEKLPTKREMVKEVRSEQSYRQFRAEPEEAPASFNPDEQYLEDLKKKVQELWDTREKASTLQPLRDSTKTEKQYQDNVLPKFNEAQLRLIGSIDYAIAKLGIEQAALTLASNDFMKKIENLEEKYTYEIVESVDDDIIPLLSQSVDTALNNI